MSSTTITEMLTPDLIKWLFEHPELLEDNLLDVTTSVCAITFSIFRKFSRIEDPFEFDKVAKCLYSLKVLEELNASFQRIKIDNSNLQTARALMYIATKNSKDLVESAQNELMETCIDIYHV